LLDYDINTHVFMPKMFGARILLALVAMPAPLPGAWAAQIANDPACRQAQAERLEQIISDMALPSEALVIDPRYPWQYAPQITMHAPRGAVIPAWWDGNRPEWTDAVVPWFTVFEAEGNKAVNSRVEVRDLRFFILSDATRHWTQIDRRQRPDTTLWGYPFRYLSSENDAIVRPEPDGGLSVVPAYPTFLHGWGHGRPIVAQDIGATFAAIEFRLVLSDAKAADDRDLARYVVDVGADYYPDMKLQWSRDYAPGIGNSRMLLATRDWRTATLLVPNKDKDVTYDVLREHPLPLQEMSGHLVFETTPPASPTRRAHPCG
jgi:hypothetical protein